MSLLVTLGSELSKIRRTAALYFTLAGAAFIPIMTVLDFCLEGMEKQQRMDPFNAVFKAEMTMVMIFPMFVILICTLVPQIEHKNNTWKQVLAAPHSKASIYFAKYLNVQILIVAFLIANLIFRLLSALIVHLVYPELDLLHQPLDLKHVYYSTANVYLFLMAVSAIQYWIALRVKNFVVPIAIGLGLWLMGTLLVLEYHSPFGVYFPYSYHVYNHFPKYHDQLNQVGLSSVIYLIIFLTLGFLDFRSRRMTT